MRYAIIKDDVVLNVIIWDGVTPIELPEGAEAILAPDYLGPNDKKLNGKWHREQVDGLVCLEPEIQMMAAPKAKKKK